jgi:hypothetical protein
MKLIWTFNSKGGNDIVRLNSKKITIINYYIHSITEAKKLGYKTIIYTNVPEPFQNIADEVINIEIKEDSSVWVNLKLKVLEERTDDYCLIDPDVILRDRLPTIENGVMFDTYEMGNWDKEYSHQIQQLKDLGIEKVFSFWDSKKRPVINCGILYITSKTLKEEFVKNWKIYRKWLLDNTTSDMIDIDSAAMIGEEYLLTLLSENLNINKYPVNQYMGQKGRYYTHYFGVKKFTSPIVPTEYILTNDNRKTII